jgi:MFS superfamily sulfate permease-like transporter
MEHQELAALGVANLGAGFSSEFVGMGSLLRETVILVAGGCSQVVSSVNAVLVILTLLIGANYHFWAFSQALR